MAALIPPQMKVIKSFTIMPYWIKTEEVLFLKFIFYFEIHHVYLRNAKQHNIIWSSLGCILKIRPTRQQMDQFPSIFTKNTSPPPHTYSHIHLFTVFSFQPP